METQIAFAFDSGQEADRFLNRLKNDTLLDVRVKRHKGGRSILVAYDLPQGGVFDTTCQQLDALAESLGGREIAL